MADISFGRLEEFLEFLFGKLPSLPTDVKNLLVTYVPYTVLIAALVILANVALTFIEGATPGVLGYYNYYLIQIANLIFGLALLSSFRLLQQNRLAGWRSLFFLNSLYLLLSVVLFGLDNLLIIALFYYVLFQLKSNYREL